MNVVAHFEKVSYEQYRADWCKAYGVDLSENEYLEDRIRNMYDNIRLPKRSTVGSAGYDFFAPETLNAIPLTAFVVPTGIRCRIEDGWVLAVFPRSGHGFKHGVRLANTVGIIDADYYGAKNEGHIHIKLLNDSAISGKFDIRTGEAFAQGIFLPFGVTDDDTADGVRVGGFGSTDK